MQSTSEVYVKLGEKGHLEYMWSYDLRERVSQLNYQITRTDKNTMDKLANILKDIIGQLLQQKNIYESIDLLTILYKMIGYTRDIIAGKGEYMLSFMMIYVWNQYFPQLAEYALYRFVISNDHPFGSWKDIKYFCNYCKEQDKLHNRNSTNFYILFQTDTMTRMTMYDTIMYEYICMNDTNEWMF